MQTTDAQFTAEEKDATRKIAHSLQVSWKKEDLSLNTLFTIGVSIIGGPDIIAGPSGVQARWKQYRYFDESAYALGMSWERGLNFPDGGVSSGIANASLDNTSGRFLPDYAGGNGELYTSILPRRPIIINAGFNYGGIDHSIPQFVGVLSKQPRVDLRSKQVDMEAFDFMDFLANKQVDQTVMFTSQRSDVVIENSLQQLGFTTAQYELDQGRQTILFGLFEKGTTWLHYINQIVQAEQGHIYQNEEGRIIFENRVHWDNHTNIVKSIYTSDVLEAEVPDDDQIINIVEINAKIRGKQPEQIVYELGGTIELEAGADVEFFVDFEDPMLSVNTPDYEANTQDDGEGSDVTGQVTIKSIDVFARSAKYTFTNSSGATAFITVMTISGRPAKVIEEVYVRDKIDSSVTAFDEQLKSIDNDYIQSRSQAETLAQSILLDYATPNKIQYIMVRAMPDLQLGDRISWQGRYWNIFGIKTRLEPSVGFIQELSLLQRQTISLFTIGVSTIGGPDVIAP